MVGTMSKPLSKQDVYNRVYDYFTRKGAKLSYYRDEHDTIRCRYRAKDGSACAAGCLIPDELYNPDFEGNRAFNRYGQTGVIVDVWPDIDYEVAVFIDEIQRIHDNAADLAASDMDRLHRFLDNLEEFAEREGLEIINGTVERSVQMPN